MAFRGLFDVPGHGNVPVYDFESDVPSSRFGHKVGILQNTASYDLRNRNNSILMGSPPVAVILAIGIVAIALGLLVLAIVRRLTETEVNEYDTDGDGIVDLFIIEVPGATYTVDSEGNIISQQGTPFMGDIGGIVNTIVVGAVVLGGLYVTFAYIIPALSKGRGRASRS